MATQPVVLDIDENEGLTGALNRAATQLESGEGKLALDFFAVNQIDSRGLKSLANLIQAAGDKGVRISACGVNLAVYKVLKLMKLSQHLSFAD